MGTLPPHTTTTCSCPASAGLQLSDLQLSDLQLSGQLQDFSLLPAPPRLLLAILLLLLLPAPPRLLAYQLPLVFSPTRGTPRAPRSRGGSLEHGEFPAGWYSAGGTVLGICSRPRPKISPVGVGGCEGRWCRGELSVQLVILSTQRIWVNPEEERCCHPRTQWAYVLHTTTTCQRPKPAEATAGLFLPAPPRLLLPILGPARGTPRTPR